MLYIRVRGEKSRFSPAGGFPRSHLSFGRRDADSVGDAALERIWLHSKRAFYDPSSSRCRESLRVVNAAPCQKKHAVTLISFTRLRLRAWLRVVHQNETGGRERPSEDPSSSPMENGAHTSFNLVAVSRGFIIIPGQNV